MIPADYESRIRAGVGLGEVLADRVVEDRAVVYDAVALYLEVIDGEAFDVGAVESSVVAALPEYRDDDEVRLMIRHEVSRRALSGFGPLLSDGRGRYTLLEQLGAGSQGTVHRAIDRRMTGGARSEVAVKILDGPMAEHGVRARSVDHPSVVPLFDEGIAPDGRGYLVYKYLDGPRLDDWVAGRVLGGVAIASLMVDLCRGVEAIHAASIVHRDLKPANIVVMSGVPVIADFGIAVEGLGDRAPAGTPGAMAPEQASGGDSTAVDIYGLGVVLRYLLGAAGGGGLGGAGGGRGTLVAIAERAMAHHAHDRYTSAARMEADLTAYLSHRPVSVRDRGWGVTAWMWVRRHPLVAAVVVLCFVGAVGYGVMQRSLRAAELVERDAAYAELRGALARSGRLQAAYETLQRRIHTMILDLRLRPAGDAPPDPAVFWGITEFQEFGGSGGWTYATLVTADGAGMLRELVAQADHNPTLSRVTVGYWWLLLARIERMIGFDPRVRVLDAYGSARQAFAVRLGERDPLVVGLDSEVGAYIDSLPAMDEERASLMRLYGSAVPGED